MTYLTTFSCNAEVPFSSTDRPSVQTVLERIERGLLDYHADIIERGEGFLTFKVPIGERVVRYLRPRVGGWGPWWPFDFVSGGTLSAAAASNRISVSGDIRSSQWYVVPASAFAIVAGAVGPFHGAIARTLVGLLVGVTSTGLLLLLGKWQFQSWLHRVAGESSS